MKVIIQLSLPTEAPPGYSPVIHWWLEVLPFRRIQVSRWYSSHLSLDFHRLFNTSAPMVEQCWSRSLQIWKRQLTPGTYPISTFWGRTWIWMVQYLDIRLNKTSSPFPMLLDLTYFPWNIAINWEYATLETHPLQLFIGQIYPCPLFIGKIQVFCGIVESPLLRVKFTC